MHFDGGANDLTGESVKFDEQRMHFVGLVLEQTEKKETKSSGGNQRRDSLTSGTVFEIAGSFGDSDEEQEREAECHSKYAHMLKRQIEAWAVKEKFALRVQTFLMDLRGHVSVLPEPTKARPRHG